MSVATPTQPCNMAATGKKGKKAKWVKANLTDILAEPTTIPATNWAADTVEETDTGYVGYGSRTRAPVVLPSVSRAARGGMAVDDESIPRRPPYIAHISNLPYDVDESAIAELFEGLKITNLRLPREGDRLKGFGYVDFEDRDSLVSAMNIADLTVSGRRIRIEVSTHDNDRRMGRSGMGRSDRDREYDPERTTGDWRSGPRVAPEGGGGSGGGGGGVGGRPRGMERERDPERGEMTRAGMREREPESASDNKPGGWRDGERAAPAEAARAPYGGRDSFGRERFGEDRDRDRDRGRERGYGGRDGFRTAERPERDGAGFGSREGRGFGGRGFGDRDRERDPPREDSRPRERPKLNLLPRTVPRDSEVPTKLADGADAEPEKPVDKPKPVAAENIFGSAKPVDTAAKEREIEERLRKQGEEARRGTDEKEKWGSRREHSGDRRSGARRDEPARDSRSYNKDRRDYSKDDKDRRNDRDRRDYSRDDRERRDYRDGGERRDDRGRNDRDYRERRDYSGERRRDSRERDSSRERGRSRDGSRGRRDGSRDRRQSSRDRKDSSRDRKDSSRDRKESSRDRKESPRDRRESSRDRRESPRDRRDGSRGGSRRRDDSRDRRDERSDYSRGRPDSRGPSDSRGRPDSRGPPDSRGRPDSRDRHPDSQDNKDERNGDPRESRSRDRRDDIDEKPLPKLKEQEKPNFVASNKFSFLDNADDADAASE